MKLFDFYSKTWFYCQAWCGHNMQDAGKSKEKVFLCEKNLEHRQKGSLLSERHKIWQQMQGIQTTN